MPFGELLEQHRIGQALVTIHRERLSSVLVTGVVRQFSKRFVLVENLAVPGTQPPAGFTLIRREDLTRIDQETETLRRLGHAVGSIARSHPIAREVDLVEWRTALESLRHVTPAVLVHREGVGDPLLLATPELRFLKHLVLGRRPDPGAADEGEFALILDHLTRIDFA